MGTLSADQIRVFLTIVEKGSFSAASRTLRRSQTAISYAIFNLEEQLGVQLFDRVGRRPTLTAAGAALVVDAQKVTHSIRNLKVRADTIARGIETDLTIVIDAFYPPDALIAPMRDFAREYPQVELTVRQEMIGTALDLVLDGSCTIGIISHAMSMRPELQPLAIQGHSIRMVAVASADHPLALHADMISAEDIATVPQIVAMLNVSVPFGNLSPTQCRCNSLTILRSMILAGTGWCAAPYHLVADDLAAGRMIQLRIAAWVDDDRSDFEMSVVHLVEAHLGPAARWLATRLSQGIQKDEIPLKN